MTRLKVHHIDPANHANGPGTRYTLWLQGCRIRCEGCFNPATHDPSLGRWMSIEDVLSDIQLYQPTIDGLTLSGGEPLDQAEGLLSLVRAIKNEFKLPVILFSGYPYNQIQTDPQKSALLSFLDVLVSGPYQQSNAAPGQFPSSNNQHIVFLSNTYTQKDMESFTPAEICISPEGEILSSGIDPFYL